MEKSKRLSKSIFALLAVLMMACGCFFLTACSSKIEKMEVQAGSIETVIEKNDTLNTDDLIVVFTFEDKKTKTLSSADLEIGTIDTSTVGTKQLSITYNEQTFYIDITVVSSLIETWDVSNDFVTTIEKGATLNTSNLNVTITFEDGRTQNLTADDLTIGAFDSSTPTQVGTTRNLTITYLNQSHNIPITVYSNEITSWEVSDEFITTIEKGNALNTSNLSVDIVFEDGREKTLTTETEGFNIGAFDSSTPTQVGTTRNLTITYLNQSYNIPITVYSNVITNMAISAGTMETKIQVNTTLNTANLIVIFTFEDGRTAQVNASELTLGTIDTSVIDTHQLSVTYLGQTKYIDIEVVEFLTYTITNMEVNPEFNATVEQNGTLDTSNLVVTFTYEDTRTEQVSASNLTLGTVNTSEVGTTQLAVTYHDQTFHIDIEVLTIEITSITLISGLETTIEQGQTFDVSNVLVLVTYADNRTEEIPASKLTFGELTFNAPTSQSNPTQIEVTYHNQTFGIPVTVLTNEVVSIELISGLETTIEQGDTLNTSNFVVLVTYADERTEEINSAQLQIGAFDSSTPTSAGDPRSLAVTYKNKTDYIGIVVLTTQITSMEVKAGSIDTTIYVKDVLDTSNLVVIFTFADSRTQEVSASNLQIGTISTSTEGTKQLSVTYKNQTFYIDIVVESQVFVTSMRSQLLIDFDNARSTQTNKQIEFYDQNQPLYVGADNPFNFRITVTAIQDGNFASGAHLAKTNIQVKLYDGENYNLLTGETLESYVAINNSEKSFDFTENAIGKKFEITITATNIDTEYDVQDTSFTAEVEVIEGYNVYNAIELSVFDNKNTNGVWTNLKAEHNLTNVTTNAIILQNNIDLTKEDLAPAYFWTTATPGYTERLQYTDLTLEGSMIDNREIGIYERDLNDGETFNFIGNYFSIDASALPKAVAEDVSEPTKVINYANKQGITAHTCLFQTDIKDNVTITTADTQINYKNIYFIGNGALSNDVRNSGALLMMKSYNVNFNSYNTITHNFYIGYMFGSGERDNEFDGEYVIEKVKSYNSYQTQIYCWGAEHTVIKDSEIIGAGGPAIIADHYGYEKSGNNFTDIGHYSTVDIINSTIESKVSGTEPWFETYEGSSALAGQMLLLEQFFDGSTGQLPALNKTIVADSVGTPAVQRMNAVVLMKSGSAEGLTSDRLMGYTRMFKSQNDYDKYYAQGEYAGQTPDTTVTYGLDMMAGTTDANALVNKAMSNNAVYIQSNGNGGYINQGFGTANTDSSMLSGVNYDQGDYLNLYLYNGMGLILQLYDTTRE